MKFVEVAKEYSDLNLFNAYTHHHLNAIARLFANRSGLVNIGDLSKTHLQIFKEKTLLVAKPITYNNYIVNLRLIGDYAVRENLLHRNHFRDVKLANVGKPPRKVLDVEAVRKTLVALEEKYFPRAWFWRAVVYTLYYTGMRRRQIVFLKMSDLNFDDETILMRYAGSKGKREWTIPMHPELKRELIRYFKIAHQHLVVALRPDDYIFHMKRFFSLGRRDCNTDTPMAPKEISRFFVEFSELSGVNISAQRFRHTLATTLCNPPDNSTPDVFSVQNFMGHAHLSTTKMYVEPSLIRMRGILNKVDSLFQFESKVLTNR